MEQPPCRGCVRARWAEAGGPSAGGRQRRSSCSPPAILPGFQAQLDGAWPSLCHHILSVGGPLLPTKGCEWVLSSKWAQRTCGGWW